MKIAELYDTIQTLKELRIQFGEYPEVVEHIDSTVARIERLIAESEQRIN